jgi:hypothetical protein
VALLKLPGVESADVSLKTASADIHLKADNKVTVTELRKVLKENGYPTRDAQIEARGRIVDSGGTLVLDLLNGSSMKIELNEAAVKPTGGIVQISGTSRSSPNAQEGLILRIVR